METKLGTLRFRGFGLRVRGFGSLGFLFYYSYRGSIVGFYDIGALMVRMGF